MTRLGTELRRLPGWKPPADGEPAPERPADSPAAPHDLAQGAASLAAALIRRLSAAPGDLIAAPFSLRAALALALTAAVLTAEDVGAQNSTYRYKTNNRNATESIDAAVYNPAGMIWLADGVHVEVGNQLGFGTKEIYDGLTGQTYEATGGSAFDPTAILVYKKSRWAFSFAFGASSAAGGELKDGSPMISLAGASVASGLAVGVSQALTGPPLGLPGEAVDPYVREMYRQDGGSLEERSLDLGFMANTAWQATGWLSCSVGARYLYRTDDVLRGNVKVATSAEARAGLEQSLLNDLGLPREDVDALMESIPVVDGDVARVDAGYDNNDYWTFSLGVNLRPTQAFLIAQTLSFGPDYTAHLQLNELYLIDPALQPGLEDLLDMVFADGAPDDRSVVPLYRLGVAWRVGSRWRVEADLHVDFERWTADGGPNEYAWGLGAEFQVSRTLNWGAGFKYQPVRRDPDDMSDTDFDNDMLWLATGVDLAISRRLTCVATVELGLPTSEHLDYADDGTTLIKSYKDKANKSATLGAVFAF